MGFPKVPVRTIETEGRPTRPTVTTPERSSGISTRSRSPGWHRTSRSWTSTSPSRCTMRTSSELRLLGQRPQRAAEMNASFGECEQDPTNPVTGPLAQLPYGTEFGDELEAVAEPILRQATIEGRTLFAAAGDTGSGCPEVVAPVIGAGNGLAVQPVPDGELPCASDYAVCVGGTVVSVNGTTEPQESQRASETSWTFGGGGTSHFIAEPSFQAGWAMSIKSASALHRAIRTTRPRRRRAAGSLTWPTCQATRPAMPTSSIATANLQARAVRACPARSWSGSGHACRPGRPKVQARAASASPTRPSTTRPLHGSYTHRSSTTPRRPNTASVTAPTSPAPAGTTPAVGGRSTWPTSSQPWTAAPMPPGAYGGTEEPAVTETQAVLTSPTGNATDPVDVSLGNDPSARHHAGHADGLGHQGHRGDAVGAEHRCPAAT